VNISDGHRCAFVVQDSKSEVEGCGQEAVRVLRDVCDSLFPSSVTPEVERGSCEVTRKGIPRGGMGISCARGG
jgi:hypothetical protein